jgi:hypothetical protein
VLGNFGTGVEQKLTLGVLNAAARTKDLGEAMSDQEKAVAEAAKKQKDAMDPAAMKKLQEGIATLSNEFTKFLAQNMPMLTSAFGQLTSLVTSTLLPAFNFLMSHFTAIVAGLVAFKLALAGAALYVKAQEMKKAISGPGTAANPAHVLVRNPGALGGGAGVDVDGDGKGKKGGKGKFGKIGNFVKGAGAVGAVVGAGMLYSDISDINEQEKKGEITAAEAKEKKGGAVGGAVGGAGGAMAGAAAGAALGSVVPILGTAIGGIVGGIVGGYLGRSGGEAAGKKVMAETKSAAKTATPVKAEAPKSSTAPTDTRVPINYGGGPEALLKQFVNQENTPMVKEAQQKVAQAEAARKEIEAKAQAESKAKEDAIKKAEMAAKEKAAAEATAKEEAAKKTKGGAAGSPAGQESAETLLAQLNSNMAQLIKINKEQKDIGERQLGVQRSLTGDLFASV